MDARATNRKEQNVEHPEVNPGGEPPEDDRNDEDEGSPAPDPTEETIEVNEIPEAD